MNHLFDLAAKGSPAYKALKQERDAAQVLVADKDEWRAFHKAQADHFREALWKIGHTIGDHRCRDSEMARAARLALDAAPKYLDQG